MKDHYALEKVYDEESGILIQVNVFLIKKDDAIWIDEIDFPSDGRVLELESYVKQLEHAA